MAEQQTIQYTPKDFKSDQEVRWCPGCGDHAVLNAIQKALTELGIRRRNLFSSRASDAPRGSLIIWILTVSMVSMAGQLQLPQE